jgi:hypothetical protein
MPACTHVLTATLRGTAGTLPEHEHTYQACSERFCAGSRHGRLPLLLSSDWLTG